MFVIVRTIQSFIVWIPRSSRGTTLLEKYLPINLSQALFPRFNGQRKDFDGMLKHFSF